MKLLYNTFREQNYVFVFIEIPKVNKRKSPLLLLGFIKPSSAAINFFLKKVNKNMTWIWLIGNIFNLNARRLVQKIK